LRPPTKSLTGAQESSNCLVAQSFRAAVGAFPAVSVERLRRADGSGTKTTKVAKITNAIVVRDPRRPDLQVRPAFRSGRAVHDVS